MAALSRLATALSEGLVIPDGPIAVVRPPLDYDLSPLPKDAVRIVTTFAPDHAAWAARGYAVDVVLNAEPTVIIIPPRSKALTRDTIAQASGFAARIILDGPKSSGIDSLWKDARKIAPDSGTLTKAHGRIFWTSGGDFGAWRQALGAVAGFVTQPGVFSEAKVDAGSRLLAAQLPQDLTGAVADLGAGWGYLARAILDRPGVTALHLVEAEALALNCAQQNVTDPRAQLHWADATRWTAPDPLDAVVMNPPFHTGRDGDPALGQAFIRAAAQALSPRGTLWMVANRHLPYEATLDQSFKQVQTLADDGAFKVLQASRPAR